MLHREGALGIIRYQNTVTNLPEQYDVTFGRYDRGGVLRPRRLQGREGLIRFLERDAHPNNDALKSMLETIDAGRSAHIHNIVFTDDEIARLGFSL